MKTTIDIPSVLLEDAQALARHEGTTLKALTEEALRKLIAERRARRGGYRLEDRSVGGNGLNPDLRAAGWERIRALVYEGRGD